MKAFLAAVLLGASLACAAQTSSPPLLHTPWLARDGAPRDVQGIAQTPDGWLWLGNADGLHRFDGVSFTRWQPPPGVTLSTNINYMGMLPDGTLWATPFFGGLYLIKGDAVRVFGAREGFPQGSIGNLAGDQEGRLWLAMPSGLYLLEPKAERWRRVSEEFGLPEGGAYVLVDRAGTVWFQSARGNHAMRRGQDRFTLVAPQESPGSLAEGPDGVVWAIDGQRRGPRRLTPGTTPAALQKLFDTMIPTLGIHIDNYGGFWFPAQGGVVRLVMNGERAEAQHYSPRQGLSGRESIAPFNDREGNVWISTEGGLDQFRPSRMVPLALPHYKSDARPLAAGPDGALWIDGSWLRNVDAQPRTYLAPDALPSSMHQLHRDARGNVLFGTRGQLWRLDGFKPVAVPLPPEARQDPQQLMYAIASDVDDGLWISLGPRGTMRLKDGVWTAHGGIAGLKAFPVTSIVAGPGERLWFGSVGNAMALLQGGVATRFGPADGLDIGAVLAILPEAAGAWLGGDSGLAWFDGRRAIRLQGEDGEQFRGGTGLVRGRDGNLWINAVRGLFSIRQDELDRALKDPAYRLRYRRYDENDGLNGSPGPLHPSPSMVATSDGRLVISTTGGVFHFDPVPALTGHTPPPVQVTAITAGDASYPARGTVSLPAAPETVRIDYTALSLSLPRRVRFQYRLEGVDSGWQDAGNRRAAFYTRLAPGNYTFRVKAADGEGVWNEEGAQVKFTVAPTLVQTLWFKFACALALLLAVYSLHRLRLRMALGRLRRGLEARVAERERIARDLHDTLLQSVQGLIMHFGRIAARTPGDAPTRAMMNDALALATDVLEEGRDKVSVLRTTAQDADLAGLLEAHGQRLAAQHGVAFAFTEQGGARPLRAAALEEMLAIGREAISNAFLHASARRIEVELAHGERDIVLTVRDDGAGIDPAYQDGREGHWGILGMRERAAELGGALDLHSAPGAGCTWRLRLPTRLAYASVQSGAAAA